MGNVREQLNPYSSHEGNHWVWLPGVFFFNPSPHVLVHWGSHQPHTLDCTCTHTFSHSNWFMKADFAAVTRDIAVGGPVVGKWSCIWQRHSLCRDTYCSLWDYDSAVRKVTHLFIKLPNQSTSTSEALWTSHWHRLQKQKPWRSKFVVLPLFLPALLISTFLKMSTYFFKQTIAISPKSLVVDGLKSSNMTDWGCSLLHVITMLTQEKQYFQRSCFYLYLFFFFIKYSLFFKWSQSFSTMLFF